MNALIAHVVALGIIALGLAAPRAEAQLSSAELFVDVDAGVSAVDMDIPLQTALFSDGPRSDDIFLESGTIPWNLDVVAGGGEASTTGQLHYLATTTSQIFTTGDFTMHAAATAPAAALAGFDAGMSIGFQVEVQTTFTLTGHVSTARELSDAEVVACQYNGVVLAGDSRATPLDAGIYTFDVERTLFPGETGTLQCSAASSGGTSDINTLTWEVAVNGLPEPASSAGTLASLGTLAALRRRRARPLSAPGRSG